MLMCSLRRGCGVVEDDAEEEAGVARVGLTDHQAAECEEVHMLCAGLIDDDGKLQKAQPSAFDV